jgi:hypothetical protein
MVVAAGPKRRRESATRASPHQRGGPLSETSASRHLSQRGARSGNRALRLLCLERLPMSIRNGTSSSVNPQPLHRCLPQAAIEREKKKKKKKRSFGDGGANEECRDRLGQG